MWKRLILGLLLGVALLSPPPLRAQMSEEDKRRLFLKAREDIRPVPRPAASATPRPKPKPAATPEPTPTPRPKPTATPEPEEPEPTPKPKPTPEKEEEPPPKKKEEEPAPKKIEKEPEEEPAKPPAKEQEEEQPTPKPTPTPKATATPKATPPQVPKGTTKTGDDISAPIVIEKSGLDESQGIEPAPKSSGGWFKRYRYLTPAVRKSIDNARVLKGRWKYIIIHNSGTRQGNARIFDNYHRRVRKMQNGLAYHFVIGNGSSSGDGEIEIGPRWTKQINGGHVASDYMNNIAIGICLVGDLNRDQPTKAQLAAIDELVTYLRGRVGKIKGKPAIVVPHKTINVKPTDCPGDRFPYAWLRQKFGGK